MLKFVYDISSLFKKYKYLSICKKLPVRIILGCFVYKETFNTNLYQEVKIRTILTKSFFFFFLLPCLYPQLIQL